MLLAAAVPAPCQAGGFGMIGGGAAVCTVLVLVLFANSDKIFASNGDKELLFVPRLDAAALLAGSVKLLFWDREFANS